MVPGTRSLGMEIMPWSIPNQATNRGMMLRQCNRGGKLNLLGISKRGDRNLGRFLVQCVRVYILRLGALADGVCSMLARRHSNVVVCAR